jgi:exportin-2 (importin alpha re-exporter)
MTCHKLFKKYRFSFRSDNLWREINQVVEALFQPYFTIATQLFSALQSSTSDVEIRAHIQSFIPLLKVLYSLNSQDIPQCFDDSLKEWMTLLNFLLNFLPSNLTDDTSLFILKSKVLKCLTLFAQKYDEDFEPYVKNFCTSVWELLSRASGFSQYDRFVSACLEFFRVVTFKPQIAELIHANLGVMFSSLILPNMIISEAEEETAEASPMEFVKMFLEDANEDTRRCACGQLMKVLIKQFPADVNRLVLEQQRTVLSNFNSSPKTNWKQMDALVLLLSGVFPTLYTSRNGATSVATTQEHIVELYHNLISPQLADQRFPVLKSSCLKFIYVYRNQFPKEMLLEIMGKVIVFLGSDSLLLASYAAATLERMLMIKNDRELLFTKDFIAGVLKQLLQNIAEALQKHGRNTYIMNVFFRVMWISQDLFASFAIPACDIFINYIKQVITDPQDSEPHFNWLLFECIALSMKWAGPSVIQMQEKLEPYMALIIQKSHPDLLPYAFQIQSFFIKLTSQLSQTNQSLILSVLPVQNWEAGSRYYLPTLVIFLENVLITNSQMLKGHIEALGTITHRLFTLGLDGQAFSLLGTLVEIFEVQDFANILHSNYLIIFTKLHNSKSQNIKLSPRFHRGIISYVSTWILKFGWESLAQSMNVVQNGIFFMLLKGEVLQNLRALETVFERRAAVLALTAILRNVASSDEVCYLIMQAVCRIIDITTNIFSGTLYSNGLVDLPEENTIQVTRDSFQKIYSAEFLPVDKYAAYPDEKKVFVAEATGKQYQHGFTNYFADKGDQNTFIVLQKLAGLYGISVN